MKGSLGCAAIAVMAVLALALAALGLFKFVEMVL